jgi:hypothetical protein
MMKGADTWYLYCNNKKDQNSKYRVVLPKSDHLVSAGRPQVINSIDLAKGI